VTFKAIVLISLCAYSGAVLAAEPDTRSPYDTNPKCTERTADGTSPECTLQTEGTPRQVYPPRVQRPVTPPPQTPPPPPPRASNRDSGKAGGGAAK